MGGVGGGGKRWPRRRIEKGGGGRKIMEEEEKASLSPRRRGGAASAQARTPASAVLPMSPTAARSAALAFRKDGACRPRVGRRRPPPLCPFGSWPSPHVSLSPPRLLGLSNSPLPPAATLLRSFLIAPSVSRCTALEASPPIPRFPFPIHSPLHSPWVRCASGPLWTSESEAEALIPKQSLHLDIWILIAIIGLGAAAPL